MDTSLQICGGSPGGKNALNNYHTIRRRASPPLLTTAGCRR
jgi:hypothetical protein